MFLNQKRTKLYKYCLKFSNCDSSNLTNNDILIIFLKSIIHNIIKQYLSFIVIHFCPTYFKYTCMLI